MSDRNSVDIKTPEALLKLLKEYGDPGRFLASNSSLAGLAKEHLAAAQLAAGEGKQLTGIDAEIRRAFVDAISGKITVQDRPSTEAELAALDAAELSPAAKLGAFNDIVYKAITLPKIDGLPTLDPELFPESVRITGGQIPDGVKQKLAAIFTNGMGYNVDSMNNTVRSLVERAILGFMHAQLNAALHERVTENTDASAQYEAAAYGRTYQRRSPLAAEDNAMLTAAKNSERALDMIMEATFPQAVSFAAKANYEEVKAAYMDWVGKQIPEQYRGTETYAGRG